MLFKVASGVEQVDRALFLRQLGLLRPHLDGHLRTMRIIGGVKVPVAANVILQLSRLYDAMFTGPTSILIGGRVIDLSQRQCRDD